MKIAKPLQQHYQNKTMYEPPPYVLLIDDDEDDLEMLSSGLEKKGIKVVNLRNNIPAQPNFQKHIHH